MAHLDEPSAFEKLYAKVTQSQAVVTAFEVGAWAVDRLWPIYSMGVIVAAVSLVGAVHEKQSLADHIYGAALSDAVTQDAEAAQNALDDETSHLVRSEVFTWTRNKFKAEARNMDL